MNRSNEEVLSIKTILVSKGLEGNHNQNCRLVKEEKEEKKRREEEKRRSEEETLEEESSRGKGENPCYYLLVCCWVVISNMLGCLISISRNL